MDILLSIRKQQRRMSQTSDGGKSEQSTSRSGLMPVHLPPIRDEQSGAPHHLHGGAESEQDEDESLYQLPQIVGLNPHLTQEDRDALVEAESYNSTPRRSKNVILRVRHLGLNLC